MEKQTTPTTSKIAENLTLYNRSELKVDGITEVITSNDSSLVLKLKDTTLTICGKDLTITKLDVNTGNLECKGTIDSIKYGQKTSLFRRMFK